MWQENDFCENLPVDSADTLRVKNFVEIALGNNRFVKITLARSVSKINTFFHFTQKLKMAAKSGGKMILGKTCQ